MNGFLKVILIYTIVIIIGVGFYLYFNTEQKIDINEGKEQVTQLEAYLKENKHDHHNVDDESGYHHNEKYVKMFQDVEQTLIFFVAVLQEENEELFTSFFIPQQYSDDLWAYSDNPYKDKTNHQFMRELNRNGKLVSAKYNTSIMEGYKTKRKDSEVELDLVYNDGKQVKLKLNLVLMGTEHSNDDDIYFIENSVIGLINEVKAQTK
ncbi:MULTISPECIES: hypothetical protein [Cytobacillus]|uniref:Uncharacterized protein n=1 Tax=Cytobacillus oceanisediminis TaxID=665099 RepID=A0ABX3CMA0_9BACI|nr:hypothetical protein [Cytobacillus oceanisediminis]EFV75070.1 hypothetical protein HMPREF1013_04715 [Bacillus sp. 2_A_57_CT2]OHX44614.1 hypothetical protein BBV17_25670 [Cytobacillus oceanisediminis]